MSHPLSRMLSNGHHRTTLSSRPMIYSTITDLCMRTGSWLMASSTSRLTTLSNRHVAIANYRKRMSLRYSPMAWRPSLSVNHVRIAAHSKLKVWIWRNVQCHNARTKFYEYLSNHSLATKCLQTDIGCEDVFWGGKVRLRQAGNAHAQEIMGSDIIISHLTILSASHVSGTNYKKQKCISLEQSTMA